MKRVCLAYGLLGAILWFIPLLNVLQVESGAVVAFVAFFVAGWAAVQRFRGESAPFPLVLARQEAALLIPLGMLTVSQLWAPNCTYVQGVLFYALFPGVTVVFAVSLAYLATGARLTRPVLAVCGVGVLLSLVGPIYDLGFHPQFYTYNHVFGGVLGPIYDEQLAIRGGLFAYRGLTIVWACAAWLGGRILRGKEGWSGLLGCAAVIGLCYWWAVPLGLNTSETYLQDQLGGHVRTEHFDVYYSPERMSADAVEVVAEDHEAIYRWLHDRLGLRLEEGPDRIQSYLYPNPDVKAQLTGARQTSVSPVWLGRPQVHLLVDRVDASLGHELAHTFSRSYGMPLLKASWSPGLVEGWAVALEPPAPYPSSHDLVRVATTTGAGGALSKKANSLSTRLTPWGFWTGRGAVSYATMGSFVEHLLERYGPDRLKAVYARGNFETVYGRSLSVLAREWSNALAATPMISRSAHDVVDQQFTQPSLFEVDCPHHVPAHRRHLQAAQKAERRHDSIEVERHLRKALAEEPQYIPAHAALARRRLARGEVAAVRRQLDTLAVRGRSVQIGLLRADARGLDGEPTAARRLYEQARQQLPLYAHESRARLMLRSAGAEHPDLVQSLVSGEPARVQARSLSSSVEEDGSLVRVWNALRFLDAHRYEEADSLLQRVPTAWAPEGPRAWRQSYSIQQRAWRARAAHRSGRFRRAEQAARAGAKMASERGAQEWAQYLQWWARRASDARSRRSASH